MKRLDQVGSFLRPKKLKDARESYAKGEISKESLKNIENECVAELVRLQNENGLYYINDGEFKRSWWHLDFYWGFDGVQKLVKEEGFNFNDIKTRAEGVKITGKIECKNHPFLENFKDLINIAKNQNIDISRLKLTIPSPNMFIYSLLINPNDVAKVEHYSDNDELKKDILKAYDDFYKAFYELGGRYIHLDDVSFGLFCDENIRARIEKRGINIPKCIEDAVDYLNESLKNLPQDMITSVHICKGNFRSRHYASGGYDYVAKKLFSSLNVKKFFLEFDDDRSGDFSPLKYIKNQIVVLGILTTKVEKNPSLDELKQRAYEASKIISPRLIEFSTQCGFSSTEEGNEISYESQWEKIRLLVSLNKELEKENFFDKE